MAFQGASGYGPDGIYRSPRKPVAAFPSDPSLSMIPFLFRNSASYPDRLAIVDPGSGESLTFAALHSAVHSAAAGLQRLGVGDKGSVVLIFAPNSVHFVVSFLAVLAAGFVATTVNTLYTAQELSKQAKDSGARLVITIPELWHKAGTLGLPAVFLGPKTTTTPIPATTFPASGELSAIYDFTELKAASETEYSPPESAQSDVAALLYSSGTTGLSKGVVLTHRNFICTAVMVTGDQERKREPPNTFLCFLPMFHIFGLSVISYAQLQRGNTLVVMPKFELEAMLRSIEEYKATHLFLVPPVMIALAKHKELLVKYDLSSLTFVCSGAAPLGTDVIDEVAKSLKNADILQAYGLTEVCGFISMEYTEAKARQYGSVGFLAFGVQGKVISKETQEPLSPNKHGELCFRGPNIMKGYLNNPQATELTLDKEGWLHTGDLGYFDEKGQLFVVDRLKELIKYKGFQVAPAELEGLLLSHPDILDAVVIPYPDSEAGEIPAAYVVLSPNSSLTREAVQEFIANQVAPFKKLRRVTFVGSVPKSASGKILRRELVQMVRSTT